MKPVLLTCRKWALCQILTKGLFRSPLKMDDANRGLKPFPCRDIFVETVGRSDAAWKPFFACLDDDVPGGNAEAGRGSAL